MGRGRDADQRLQRKGVAEQATGSEEWVLDPLYISDACKVTIVRHIYGSRRPHTSVYISRAIITRYTTLLTSSSSHMAHGPASLIAAAQSIYLTCDAVML